MAFIPAIIVGGQLVVAVADRPPQVNFEQTCRAASSETLSMNDHFDDCVKSEKSARDQLATQWSTFNAADRDRCGRMATIGGTSSYVELLTCLEMEKRAKSLHSPSDKAVLLEPEPPRVREPATPPPPVRPAPQRVEAAAPPAPLQLTPQLNGLLLTLCESGLGKILPACR
jgi:hypothetical protein